jgi:hypothetical protein
VPRKDQPKDGSAMMAGGRPTHLPTAGGLAA